MIVRYREGYVIKEVECDRVVLEQGTMNLKLFKGDEKKATVPFGYLYEIFEQGGSPRLQYGYVPKTTDGDGLFLHNDTTTDGGA